MIDRLESLVTKGRKLPLGRRSLMDSDELLELVDRIRVAIPTEIQEAREILKSRETILNQSVREAQRTRTAAESESKSRVDVHELVKKAQERAQQIEEEAQQKAQRLLERVTADLGARRAGADEYAQEVLQKLEQEISSTLVTVRRGIEALGSQKEAVARR